jgi:hypothetical protein
LMPGLGLWWFPLRASNIAAPPLLIFLVRLVCWEVWFVE